MIAIDTNILVYAHRLDSQWHERAKQVVTQAAEARAPWAIPWPCLHEFLAIVTRRIYVPATPLDLALGQIDTWRESPSLVLLSETEDHWASLKQVAAAGRVIGGAIHDARVAAICLDHGVSELLSADRDFSRFPGLKVRNPLV